MLDAKNIFNLDVYLKLSHTGVCYCLFLYKSYLLLQDVTGNSILFRSSLSHDVTLIAIP